LLTLGDEIHVWLLTHSHVYWPWHTSVDRRDITTQGTHVDHIHNTTVDQVTTTVNINITGNPG